MALSADKKTEYREGIELEIPVYQAVTIYAGAAVCINAGGYAVPGEDAEGLLFAGIARENADNSSGQSGDITVKIRRRGVFKMKLATAITIANVGDNVFLADDEEVDLVGNVNHPVFCGMIVEYIDTTHAWVDIEPALWETDVTTHIEDASEAHGATAIGMTDSGEHFAAAEASVEDALQKLSKTITLHFCAPTITSTVTDQKIAENFELPVPFRIKRAYATVGTAPGGTKVLTVEIKVGAAADASLVTVTGTATTGETENLNIAVAADEDFDILLTQDGGAAANLNLMLVAEVDDGE